MTQSSFFQNCAGEANAVPLSNMRNMATITEKASIPAFEKSKRLGQPSLDKSKRITRYARGALALRVRRQPSRRFRVQECSLVARRVHRRASGFQIPNLRE